MRTPIVVCLLLSIAAGPVLAQDKAPAEAAKAEPAKPRDGEAGPKAETRCEPQTWIVPGKGDRDSPDWIIPARPERSSDDARR
jgi:hypothetical protein